MRVFVTGATGLIGRNLCRSLVDSGHAVTALSRSGAHRGLPPQVRLVQGDPVEPGPWQEELAACDACVNLAGEPVASGRWTAARKRTIRESRVRTTTNVAAVIAARGPRVLVSGSGIDVYEPRGDEPIDETAPAGKSFLASVVRDWEAAAQPARARARVALIRTGLVLAAQGGALERMLLPFRMFVGGPIGDGAFWHSWIHISDEVEIIRYALESAGAEGPMNSTSPEPVRNRDFAHALGRALGRPSFVPTPVFALRAAVGEMAEMVLASRRVLPKKALGLGYTFRFPRLDAALADLLA